MRGASDAVALLHGPAGSMQHERGRAVSQTHWTHDAHAPNACLLHLLRSLDSLLLFRLHCGRGSAEHCFPFGNLSSSQDWSRCIVNGLLWLLVFALKLLFDFFVVLRPLARGPVAALLQPLMAAEAPWYDWAQAVLLVASLWVAAAFLVVSALCGRLPLCGPVPLCAPPGCSTTVHLYRLQSTAAVPPAVL